MQVSLKACGSLYGLMIMQLQWFQNGKQLSGQQKWKLRVCGDYYVTVNQQLEGPHQPKPLPEDLIKKLGGGHGFSKINLPDACNQICLVPESQRRLVLSSSTSKALADWHKLSTSKFQEIIEQLTQDLPGVPVYLDDILVSRATTKDHKGKSKEPTATTTIQRTEMQTEKMCICQALGGVPSASAILQWNSKGILSWNLKEDANPYRGQRSQVIS